MSHHHPLVSICIPAYNSDEYIRETLQCLCVQTYPDIEIIIVDDGSNDNTLSIIEGFTDERILLICQKNAGASAARNLAFNRSAGRYIKFLDSDDLINPKMVESQVKLIMEHKDCIISAKWGRFYNNDLSTFKLNPENCWQTLAAADWLCSSWKFGGSMTQAGLFLIPRDIVEKAGPWDEQLTLIDDLDFFTRVILKSNKVIFDANSILYYRSGNFNSLSNRKTKASVISAFKSIDQATKNLSAVNHSAEVLEACANIWQHFIYDTYPKYPELVSEAQKKIITFDGATLKFICGGITKVFVTIFGWKTTKNLKQIIGLS